MNGNHWLTLVTVVIGTQKTKTITSKQTKPSPPSSKPVQHLCRQIAVIAVGLTTCFALVSASKPVQPLCRNLLIAVQTVCALSTNIKRADAPNRLQRSGTHGTTTFHQQNLWRIRQVTASNKRSPVDANYTTYIAATRPVIAKQSPPHPQHPCRSL